MTSQEKTMESTDPRVSVTREQWDSLIWDAWRSILEGRGGSPLDAASEYLGAARTLFRVEERARPSQPSRSVGQSDE